jgi:serine phosphatase RsbU (regulator of sigma subunit)
MRQNLMTTTIDNSSALRQGCILVVSNSSETIKSVNNSLFQDEFDVLVASEAKSALTLFEDKYIDYVMIEADCIDVEIDELVYTLRVRAGNVFIPIIILASAEDENLLSVCLTAGCDDFLFKPLTATALKARFSSLQQVCELKKLYKSSIAEQLVAKQILAYALSERNIQFEEIQLLSKSKAVFSGDLFLTAKRPGGGLHLLAADFTGHGLSAAIGALPVADIFSVMTGKGFELEDILENINTKLHTLLPVSMFMACCMLKIDSDLKHASVWNGGMPDIYLRDGQTGEIKNKIKAGHIPLGIDEATINNFKLETIDIRPKDQFIIYTDGLTEAENASGDMFGYKHLDKCLDNSRNKELVFANIVATFNEFCGDVKPSDDVTLACITCTDKMTEVNDSGLVNHVQISRNRDYDWCW